MSVAAHFCRRLLPTRRPLAAALSRYRSQGSCCHAVLARHASTTLARSLQYGRLNVSSRIVQSRRYIHSRGIEEDTIYALSTAAGTAAIAVVRISGPACIEIYHAFCPSKPLPNPRYATLRTLHEPDQPATRATVLDPGAMVLFFPGPNTVTGEDVLELHLHGGPATVKAVLSAISRCSSTSRTQQFSLSTTPSSKIRYAEPGEFTRRAFLNARLSLPQVEALSATLTAQTEQQRKIAARGATSALSDLYESWRTQLLDARAELEALIDFAEDQHFDESPRELAASVARLVAGLRTQIAAHRENAVRGELLRGGISVALLGAPNAGKSSLLNRIVGREAAIVSQEAGTTRDVVEVGVDLGGWLVKLGDTAGLRGKEAEPGAVEVGEVEREGIRRAKERAAKSDVVIVLLPVEATSQGDNVVALSIDSLVLETARQCLTEGRSILVAINKVDKATNAEGRLATQLLSKWKEEVQAVLSTSEQQIFAISCTASPPADAQPAARGGQDEQSHDPGNVQHLLHGLTRTFFHLTQPVTIKQALGSNSAASGHHEQQALPDMSIWQDSLGASERQRLLLEDCMAHLGNFLAHTTRTPDSWNQPTHADASPDVDIAVAAESLRAAADCLAKITGRGEGSDVEEVLGVVFEKFCVGK